MPRENRKRGKKHKKKTDEAETRHHEAPHESEQPSSAGPSWIVSAPEAFEVNQEAPFGYVDVQIKTYFRTVDLQIREWQESKAVVEEDGDVDPNEDRHLFFVAALTEMSGKEKQLATDPDCSSILERMIYSMDDFARRVFMDRLSGSFEQLIRHRFASHVCQTLFTVTSETVSRESRGIFPPALNPPEDGELRTMSQLVVDACEELLPAFTSLLMDSFASHVLRALLLLLDPNSFALDGGSSASYAKTALYVRSKKSAEYKARQGPMKSVFTDNDAQNEKDPLKHVPQTFYETAHKFVLALRDQLDDNEVRALAANQVASPVLQMLLEVEAAHDIADVPKSLMDRALVGLITLSHTDPSAIPEPSDYLGTLLRDPTASHLLEALVRRVPQKVFDVLWSTYFKEQLPKLAVHPVANFVVAQALKRVSVEQMDDVFEKLDGALGKIIKASRIGVLNVMVDRVACLQAQEERVMQTICSAFKLTAPDDKALVVPCILRVQPREDYQAALSARADQAAMKEGEPSKKKARGRASADDNDPLEPKTQGALLLQAMLRLPVPHNELVLDSIQALSLDERLAMAHHVTSSRVLDALLDSATVPNKAKRLFITSFLGHFHRLVDDRIGSRVGDRCWAFADPYLKEKIARSVVSHEHFLAGSYYGKFFARKLNLHLLQRNPEQWKDLQSASKSAAPRALQAQLSKLPPTPTTTEKSNAASSSTDKPEKRKRRASPGDEIDELFDTTLGKKVKKGDLGHKSSKGIQTDKEKQRSGDKELDDGDLKDVIGAIRAAPKGDNRHRKKKVR